MYSVEKHYVKFIIHHQVNNGEAIYIVGNIEELATPVRMEVIDDVIWSQRIHINVDRYDFDSVIVQYKYFVAPFDNPAGIIRDIKPTLRTFKLADLKNHFMVIHDKENYDHWEKRFTKKDLRKLINFDIIFPYHVEFGEAIYILGPLGQTGAQNIQQAERMEYLPKDKWKISISLEQDVAFKHDKLEFMFIRSYYFKRDPNHWIELGKARSLDMKKSPFHAKRELKDITAGKQDIYQVTIRDDLSEWNEIAGGQIAEKTTSIINGKEKPVYEEKHREVQVGKPGVLHDEKHEASRVEKHEAIHVEKHMEESDEKQKVGPAEKSMKITLEKPEQESDEGRSRVIGKVDIQKIPLKKSSD